MGTMTPACATIIFTNLAIFLFAGVAGPIENFALWPIGSGFDPWQLVTYGFLHGSFTHVALNMFGVYMFGPELERSWGSQRFVVYFLACIFAAGLVQTLVTFGSAAPYPTVGASGGLFGLLLAFAVYYPQRRILLLIPPIPMPAWVFVTLYGLIELVLGVTNTQSGVAHFAHLGGMLGGFLLLRRWHARR